MVNYNKTVEQVCDKLRQFRDCDGDYVREIEDLADEAEAAHKREIEAYELELDRWWNQGHKDRAKMKSLRTKNEKLRKLVKELADALEERLCDFDCETNGKCPADMKREECESFNMRPLVARARKVIA